MLSLLGFARDGRVPDAGGSGFALTSEPYKSASSTMRWHWCGPQWTVTIDEMLGMLRLDFAYGVDARVHSPWRPMVVMRNSIQSSASS
jgi:hypothetical protein